MFGAKAMLVKGTKSDMFAQAQCHSIMVPAHEEFVKQLKITIFYQRNSCDKIPGTMRTCLSYMSVSYGIVIKMQNKFKLT